SLDRRNDPGKLYPGINTTNQISKGKAIFLDEQAAQSLLDLQKPNKKNAENGVDTEKSNSVADTKIMNVAEDQGKEVSNTVALEERTAKLDEGQAGSDPGDTHKSRPTPELELIEEDQTGSNPGQSHDKTIKSLGSRVYTVKNHDLYSKIDKQVNKVVKEAVHDALQAPILERFRDLSEVQMKEILHYRMFESGSYRSHPDHSALYEALEVSMQRDNSEELHEALVTSRKRRRDDQDPPPPPPKDSDRSKKMHDSDAFASK
nr:hypothetical protein [Tanacetum cinerariifolium]